MSSVNLVSSFRNALSIDIIFSENLARLHLLPIFKLRSLKSFSWVLFTSFCKAYNWTYFCKSYNLSWIKFISLNVAHNLKVFSISEVLAIGVKIATRLSKLSRSIIDAYYFIDVLKTCKSYSIAPTAKNVLSSFWMNGGPKRNFMNSTDSLF